MGIAYQNTTRTKPIEKLERGDRIKVDGQIATVTHVVTTDLGADNGWTTVEYTFGKIKVEQKNNGTEVEMA